MKTIKTSIAPWLSVYNGAKAIVFYTSAFGAVENYYIEDPDGNIVAKFSVDGAEFWISTDKTKKYSGAEGNVRMILTVSNPDAVFEKALSAGAKEIFPVGEEHGWRVGRLVDPFGHYWEIGRPASE